jgi:tRNA (guanine-N7-)-methyltransferase
MKPKNLKSPFSWDERKVLLQENVLFVPDYYTKYEEFTFPGWQEIFGNDKPICIEYCSGNGRWIADKALQFPENNWIAVEKRFDRTRKIWSKIQNHNINNLFIMCGMGQTITQHYIPPHSVDQVFVNFPDPWPKERHAKHRIIQGEFVANISHILKNEGSLTVVTDDDNYAKQVIEVVLANPDFNQEDSSFEHYGESYFRDLWEKLGRTINYMKFIKR